MPEVQDPLLQRELAKMDAVKKITDHSDQKTAKYKLNEEWKANPNLTADLRYKLWRALYGEPKDDPRNS